MDKVKELPKKAKKFTLKDFIEREAEEDDEVDKKDKNQLNIELVKDTQYSSEVNNEEDSYGISSDNDTEKVEKQIITNRMLLNKEKTAKEKNKIKRKRKPSLKKKNNKNKKRTMKYIEKSVKKIDKTLGIINGKLNICFDENRENKEININDNKTPEKKFKDEDDEDFLLLKMSNERRNISKANKINNESFIKRMKENENFIKKNNIIIDEGKRSKSQIIKRKSEQILLHPKLKLFNMKGAFLNKKKK